MAMTPNGECKLLFRPAKGSFRSSQLVLSMIGLASRVTFVHFLLAGADRLAGVMVLPSLGMFE